MSGNDLVSLVLFVLGIVWAVFPFVLYKKLDRHLMELMTISEMLRSMHKTVREIHDIQANAIHELDAIRRHTEPPKPPEN